MGPCSLHASRPLHRCHRLPATSKPAASKTAPSRPPPRAWVLPATSARAGRPPPAHVRLRRRPPLCVLPSPAHLLLPLRDGGRRRGRRRGEAAGGGREGEGESSWEQEREAEATVCPPAHASSLRVAPSVTSGFRGSGQRVEGAVARTRRGRRHGTGEERAVPFTF